MRQMLHTVSVPFELVTLWEKIALVPPEAGGRGSSADGAQADDGPQG